LIKIKINNFKNVNRYKLFNEIYQVIVITLFLFEYVHFFVIILFKCNTLFYL